jgi:phosphate butyryltransferase
MRLDRLKDLAAAQGPQRVAVAGAASEEALLALAEAKARGMVQCTLCGDLERLEQVAAAAGYCAGDDLLVEASGAEGAARAAVAEVAAGRAALLMKGTVSTADLLRAVLDKERGLRTGRLLSHVGVFALPDFPRLIFLTDAGVNIAPNLAQKADIVRNAIEVARALGVVEPKVAALAAVEQVNPEMPATIEAACLAAMNRRGQISGGVVDGPFGFDNAVFPEAAERKGVSGPVAGAADILVVPDLEAGNVAYKALLLFGRAQAAGVITGARVPIITTSRAEEHETKLLAIALGVVLAAGGASLS